MADEATQLRKGVLELAALAMLAPAPMYGAQIISALAEIEGLAANPGTVYPMLTRLARAGRVAATWEPSVRGGPPRKYYSITAKGRKALVAQTAAWRTLATAMNSILGEADDSQ